MKKENKFKLIVTILIGTLILLPTNIYASNAEFWWKQSDPILGGYQRYNPEIGEYKQGADSRFNGIVGGKTIDSNSIFCPDPGLNMSSSHYQMTCSDDNLNDIQRTALSILYNQYNGTHWQLQEAIRIASRSLNIYSAGVKSNLSGNTTVAKETLKRIEEAANTAVGTARNNPIDWGLGKTTNNSNSSNAVISLKEKSRDGQNYVIQVTTNLKFEDIKFTCSNCESVTPNASDKTVSVTLKDGKCNFTLNASYGNGGTPAKLENSRPVKCVGGASGFQAIIIFTDTIFDDKITAKFTPTNVTCENEPEEPEKEEDKCNQETQISVDTFCDDDQDKHITITAPTDVKYCILNNEDEAGNTYKMEDGQLDDNPYCAVYCKEDYNISMPGAKYTTSGRYFNLEPVHVHAVRTCYATDPNGNEDKGIDIEKFVKDVIEAQKNLVNKKNAYEKAKEEKELAKNANKESNICTDSEGRSYPWTLYSIPSGTYMGYDEPNCDGNTGHCDIQNPKRKSTESQTWGIKYTRGGKTDYAGTEGQECVVDVNNNWDPDKALADAENELNKAKQNLEEIIKNMEACYSWINDMCMDDKQVSFNYNEQYNTSINFKIDGEPTYTDKSAATYKQGNTIDREYTAKDSAQLEDVFYVNCDVNGECENSNEAHQISTKSTKYYFRKIEVQGDAYYKNVQDFATNYPHGTIETVSDESALQHNYYYLGAVFPVALNTPKGVYTWTLNIHNLGQYNDKAECAPGRLDDVVQWWKEKSGIDASETDIDYVCVYVVDCDDCDYECVGEYCEIPDPEPVCDECDVYCVNCIFDGDNTYIYRTISLNDFNPNDRKLGSNWTNEKGQATQDEIEKNGEEIYKTEEYRFVLDANNMKKIRDYNKKTGTYVSEDLDFDSNQNGTSKFLNDGVKEGYFKKEKLIRNDKWTTYEDGSAWK